MGQARANLRLGYLWPLCRLPSTPTIALTLPLAPLPLKTLPGSAFAPPTGEFSCLNFKIRHFNSYFQTPEASLAPGCAARPLMLDYCWPVAVSITPRAREVHSLPSHTSTTSALITLRLVSHSLHLCAPLPAPSPPQ